MKITKALLATCALVIAFPLMAQNPPASDQDFLAKAAQANLAEIETGRLAQQKSGSGEIRAFGEKMVQDHGKTLEQLRALAKARGVELPSAPDEAHQATAFKLSRASGREFDIMYVKAAGVADHKLAQQLFEAGTRSQDAEISALAKKALPDIRHHLEMAQKLSAAL